MNHLDKKLSEKILPKFANAKEWSDLMAILKKLKENIKKYVTFNMTKTTEKVLLAKRLAQGLNPSLPGGLHEITLEVYDMIFENIRANNSNMMGSDLGLYSSGLFPFFQFATVPNKTLYLNGIIRKHYLELTDQELVICLPGFLVSILPGLDDQNEALLKNIKDIFLKTRQKVGDSSFFGSLWSVILRTQRMRLVGMKYIIEFIPLYKIIEENDEGKEEYIRNYYPNLPVLVINSLTSVIEDESVHVQRLALDFIISRLPVNNKILNDEEKIPLIISGLTLLIKNDYSTTRRLFAWLLGSQEEDLEMGDPFIKYMIELLIVSIKRIFDYKNFNPLKLSNGLKIIDQLFKQQVKLVDYILENISIDLISCIEQYFNSSGNINFTNDEILGRFKKFFDYDASYLDCLWNSLGNLLFNAVLFPNESFNEVNNSIKLLKFCLIHIRLYSIDKMNKYYIPIVSSLLKALLNYKITNTHVLAEIKPLLVLALKFTHEMQEMSHISDQNKEKLNKLDSNHSIKNILKLNEQNFSMLESFKENIISYQLFYVELCKILMKSSMEDINKNDLKLFKKATELVLKTQEYSYQDNLPEWVHYLVNIVFCQEIEFSLEGINYLLDLLMVSSDNEVYSNIKYYLRSEDVNDVKFLNNFSKRHFFQTSVQRNCCELSMAKLWLLLEEQGFQKKVIDLLIKFYKAEPSVFSNTISNTFAINDLEQNVNAIKKFSQFWKLTSEYYPEIIFFENGECIFKMLDFLDHDHPLLRHLSKSWLSQSVGQFNKILDPLLKVLLDKETKWYISHSKQLYFSEEYDVRRIIEAFRKLKNIIINMTDLAINYFVNTPISPFLIEMDTIGRELSNVSRSIPMEHYLEIMVSISLRFIQGKFIESVSESFYKENFSVNAASCEFLEFLLSFIEPKSKVMNIAEMIAENVLNILLESIMSNDEVMQVQLLNLLKVLLFNNQMVNKDFIQQAINIFNSDLLHKCISLGIQINYIFVRSHFISFVEYCLPIFRDILDPDSNLKIAQKLITTTSDFLVRRVKYYAGPNHKNKIMDEKINNSLSFSHMGIQSNSKFFIIKNYLQDYKDFKTFDENDVHVIIKGLKEIIFHFLSIDNSILSPDKINWTEFKKILNTKQTSSSFRDYLGGLFSSKNFEDNMSKKNNSEISHSIFGIFEDVLASFLCCWTNDSDQIMTRDLCLNENGILSTNNEEVKFQSNSNEENTGLNPSSMISKNSKPIKNSKVLRLQIVNINMNLFVSSPFEYMKKFVSLWLNEDNKYINKDKQYKLSMIELLVEMNIPIEVILITIIKGIDGNKIKEYKRSKVRIKDNFPYYLNKDQVTYEAKICHLIFSLIVYNSNPRIDKSSIDIWNETINYFNILMESKSPITYFWLYEILNVMLQKFPIRETQTDKTIRNRLITISTNLFTKVMEISINNKIDVIFEDAGPLIVPLNPSIYEKVALEIYDKDILNIDSVINQRMSFSQIKKRSSISLKTFNLNSDLNKDIFFSSTMNVENVSDESIRNFYNNLYEYVSNKTVLKNDELLLIYRNIGFITLKSLFYSTMKNIYQPDRSDKMIVHIQALVKNLISIMNERIGMNKIYIDLATEFFHSLMISSSSMTSLSCKNMIMEFFLEPEFFNMSKKCLRLWREIISEFARFYQDIIVDLFNRLNTSSFFSKGNDKLKIIALRRVSFILYASQKDIYSNKLSLILEKVKEVITTYSENPPLEAEVFLMIRIMFLRFSHENLVEMLRDLWPIIFSELVNIITAKKKNNPLDLSLSSVKLIEELSLANMEEFSLYQWIFLIDTYDVNKMNTNNHLNIINSLLNSDSKIFKPYEMELVKDFNKNSDSLVDVYKMKNDEYLKRGLIVQTQKLNTKDELSNYVSQLFFYIALMNNFRTKIDWEVVENLIEGDFLNAAI